MKVSEIDLLDYFAAQAMAALPSDSYYLHIPNDDYIERAAESCYNLAEALMAERQKRKERGPI